MLPKVNEIVTAADKKMKEAVNFLEEDLKTYRVGKANPSILNNVVVDYYGSAQYGSTSAMASGACSRPWVGTTRFG